MSGLFGTLNVGKRGINTAQTTIDVTSHNISNANTEGFSRQRTKIEASRPMSSINCSAQIGTGAQVSAIERVRDGFLDFQVRGETSTLGKNTVRSNFLSEVETVFNEPSDTGISTLMGKFFDAYQELSKKANSSNARTVAVQQTVALTDAINHTYTKLNELGTNAQDLLKNNVTDINSMLDQVNVLNKEIKTVATSGQTPNDLMDKRDLLVDQLSSKFNLSTSKGEFESIDLRPIDSNGMKYPNLVNSNPDTQSARLSYVTQIEQDKNFPNVSVITYYKLGDMSNSDNKQTLRVADLSEQQKAEINSGRVLWADESGRVTRADGYPVKDNEIINASELVQFEPSSGEVSGNISIQKDVEEYKTSLNKLAKSIAFTVNTVHSGMTAPMPINGEPERDYMPMFVNKDVAIYDRNHNLSNLDDTLKNEQDITAANITINQEILNDVMKIKTKANDNSYGYAADNTIDGEADGSRALAIASLRDTIIRVQDFGTVITSRDDITAINNGMKIENDPSGMKMNSYYKDIIDKLGVQSQESARQVTNQESMVSSLENTKAAVSGVSLDEEMSNLIQFQHAYQANAKIISTIDDLLDVVINGLKK